MTSEKKTRQWGGFSTETQTCIGWMQRSSIWTNTDERAAQTCWAACDRAVIYLIGHSDFLRLWEDGANMLHPAGKARQERFCGDTRVLPQRWMPESNEVWRKTKTHNRTSLLFSLNGVIVTSLCVLQAACVCVCSRECSAEGQQSQSAPGTKSGTPSAG